ncbi:carboxypeptidase-like regulatory domain-containing protein [Paraflavitalea sp. CAU 1676]|uniref:carboxypeptidase-like regulatory domain-containing protein n=1 Tax=Paraflavitalea sp. CAU 1676 TaxID=3032598 RepID=UPI0023DADCE3|nr:carboxypeptidase-like regulatory domain-containing protein [Paraflavitalea sp. CAU 1676]MDF2187954.1 carboxypeptidase-like regulatory domain-containing protein [Paraflavitalea sp. CAU 1676]
MIRKHALLLLMTVGILQLSWKAVTREERNSTTQQRRSQRTITGTILAAGESTPIEGVSVAVKGTKTVSGTQADGIYYIPVTEKDSILVFSHCDFDTLEVKLTAASEYNISLSRKKNQ